VWVKLIGTPWWVRWPVTAVVLAPILVAPVPNVAHSVRWAWGLVIRGIYRLVFAALADALPRPIQCTYLAAFDGLSRSRRWYRMSRCWLPNLPGLRAAVGFVTSGIRHGVVRAWLALIAATLAVWSRYRSRNFRQHVEQLGTAVNSGPATAVESAAAEDPIALQPHRLRTAALVAIVAVMAIVPLLVVSNRPAPKCRTANAAITFTAARPNLLDTSLITPGAPRLSRYDAEKWMPSINRAMQDANITTPDQQAAFLAQIDEESGELEMVNELPWGLPRAQWNDEQAARDYFNSKYAYVNGNGNVTSGDGYNYRGRGILQITGKSNYMAVSGELYGDDRLVKNPDLLTQPDIAGAAVAAYWNENNLNRFMPPGHPVTPQQFQDLGSTINTGHPGDLPNNAAERVKYWELAKAALGIK
jgi:putative chitinase